MISREIFNKNSPGLYKQSCQLGGWHIFRTALLPVWCLGSAPAAPTWSLIEKQGFWLCLSSTESCSTCIHDPRWRGMHISTWEALYIVWELFSYDQTQHLRIPYIKSQLLFLNPKSKKLVTGLLARRAVLLDTQWRYPERIEIRSFLRINTWMGLDCFGELKSLRQWLEFWQKQAVSEKWGRNDNKSDCITRQKQSSKFYFIKSRQGLFGTVWFACYNCLHATVNVFLLMHVWKIL